MDNDYFRHVLESILYALKKILVANDNKNYDVIDAIVRQEIKATKEDLELLKEEKKDA